MFDANNIQFQPSMIGTLSTIGGTAVGAPINCTGFQHAVGFVMAGALQGSTGSTITLSVKVQESANPLGTNWTDITNEAVSQGSFKFTTLSFGNDVAGGTTTGTWIAYQAVKQVAKLSDGNRQRYIRCHATLAGTVGLGPKFVAGFIMGNPNDTLYVSSAVTVASGNPELTKLL